MRIAAIVNVLESLPALPSFDLGTAQDPNHPVILSQPFPKYPAYLTAAMQSAFEASVGHGHYNQRAFVQGVGLHLEEAEHIFSLVERSLPPATARRDFLIVFNLLKEYRHEAISGLQFDILSTSTFEEYFWSSLRAMSKSLPQVR